MDLGILIGIGGILITLIIFGIQTLNKTKNKKRSVSISLEEKQCYSLLNADTKGLKIEIKHNNKILDNPILLFKASLTNNGLKDIDEKDIKKPLILKIDNKYSVIDTTLIEYPIDSKCLMTILNKNVVEITWDLLKSGESIEFQFILEVVDSSKSVVLDQDFFYKSLVTECRITDLSNKIIKKIDVDIRIKMAWFIVISYSIFSLLSVYMLLDTYYFENKFLSSYEPIYEIVNKTNNEKIQTALISKQQGEVIIRDKNKVIIRVKDFNEKYSINKISSYKQSKSSLLFNTVFSIFVILLSILFIPKEIYKIKKSRTIKKQKNSC